MEIKTLLNFTLSRDKSEILFMSGDYKWLHDNIFHEGELYIGMTFFYNDEKYKISEIFSFSPQSEIYWSKEDDEHYEGKPSKINFELYFKCEKIK